MKYNFRFVLLLVLLSLYFGSPTAAQDTEGLQPGLAMSQFPMSLPIYSEADRQSSRLAAIEPGELVNVLQVNEAWAQIEYDDVVGWAHHSMLGVPIALINVDGPIPIRRGYHQMAYDIESDRVILFSGQPSGSTSFLGDTWSYEVNTNTWTKMAPAQSPPKGEGPLAYDAQSDRVIWFFGTDWPPSKTISETWAYDFNSDTWTKMASSTSPPPLLGARMAYDTESDRMILFGGLDPASVGARSVYLNETWTYDYEANTWVRMEPEVSPPGMNYHAIAYNAAADRVILLPTMLTGETWAYDYNTDTWEPRETSESPGRRDYSAMAYAAGIDRVILYGEGEPTSKDDTWTYDFDTNTWTEQSPGTSPSPRGWHAMVYSSADDQIILFGGGKDREHFNSETWIYDPNANTWTQVGP